MPPTEFSVSDLRRILIAAAGPGDGVQLADDTADCSFDELGYESLALLETGSRIERELGIALSDSEIVDARTPRELIAAVNAHLHTLA